jgi:hypothetical protein
MHHSDVLNHRTAHDANAVGAIRGQSNTAASSAANHAFDFFGDDRPFFTDTVERIEDASLAEVSGCIRAESNVRSVRPKACFAQKTHETTAIKRATIASRTPPP